MKIFEMELTKRRLKEYNEATKKRKSEIITEYCNLTGAKRNTAGKRFRRAIRGKAPRTHKNELRGLKPGRKPKYTSIHKAIVKKAWELSGGLCAERLHTKITKYIDDLEKHEKLQYYGDRYIQETKEISEGTLKRVLADFPKGKKKRRKGNAEIYKAIPIEAYFGENADKAGYVEIDYVEHNGGSSAGRFAITGCYVDVYSGWIARRAGLGKYEKSVKEIHERNEKKIHHKVYEYHPDNAKPILKVLWEKKQSQKPADYAISRSRPYHKEDNGHVEQKNGDKVRKLVDYWRYDTEEQVELLNRLYEVEDLISNFFLPSQKLVEKVVDDKGRVVRRKHDQAQTAYERLLESDDVSKGVKDKLKKMYNNLSLVDLRNWSDQIKEQLLQTLES